MSAGALPTGSDTMHGDAESDPNAESRYECLDCGEVVTDTSHPGGCPSCDAELRNVGTPLE